MSKKQIKVLLVENEPSVIEIVKRVLNESGHSVSVTSSTETALLRARAFHFDFFIINGGKESVQSLDFASELVKQKPYANVPFLFIVDAIQNIDPRFRTFDQNFDLIRIPIDKTEFAIRFSKLNYNKFEKETKKCTNEIKKKEEKSNKTSKVLLVEDNLLNQKVLGMFITKLGFMFDVASNGQTSVDLSKKENYQYILMDIYMPGMDGTEATKIIRANEGKGTHRAKIIAITANESEESVQRCYDSGMDDFLVKPFTLDALSEKLE